MTKPPNALLDTTVFCGALVKPAGINMRLLKLGATPLFQPVISQAMIAEFIHKACCDGIGKGKTKRIYTPEEIGLFLQAFSAILEPEQAVTIQQTYQFVSTFPGDTPLWVVLSKFANFWPLTTDLSTKLNRPINQTDLGDFHSLLAAVQTHPDVVVTSNIADIEVLKSFCEVMTSGDFLNCIGGL